MSLLVAILAPGGRQLWIGLSVCYWNGTVLRFESLEFGGASFSELEC